jgi:hypothetical protein
MNDDQLLAMYGLVQRIDERVARLDELVDTNSVILQRLDRAATRADGRNSFLRHAVETVKMIPAAALVTGALWLIERMPIPR